MSRPAEHPTHLWISDSITLEKNIISYLQKKLCPNDHCLSCATCKQVETKEHPWIRWLSPERSYSLDQIDTVIHSSSFKLDENEYRFFIFEKADCLTINCSNRLLKTIEEPHPGYNFFLLTDRPEMLPKTIVSRCITQKFTPQESLNKNKSFLQPFLTLEFKEPINFIRQIETMDIKERETKELVDSLFEHWTLILKQEIAINSEKYKPASIMILILQQALATPPMPGSTKLFWKNLYLAAHHATQTTLNKK